MKSITVLCAVVALLTACTNPSTEMPADFPADVPIISGEIYRAKHSNFEDGPFPYSILNPGWPLGLSTLGGRTGATPRH